MRLAYAMAGLAPETVSLVECHATGTPVGMKLGLHVYSEVILLFCDHELAGAHSFFEEVLEPGDLPLSHHRREHAFEAVEAFRALRFRDVRGIPSGPHCSPLQTFHHGHGDVLRHKPLARVRKVDLPPQQTILNLEACREAPSHIRVSSSPFPLPTEYGDYPNGTRLL